MTQAKRKKNLTGISFLALRRLKVYTRFRQLSIKIKHVDLHDLFPPISVRAPDFLQHGT